MDGRLESRGWSSGGLAPGADGRVDRLEEVSNRIRDFLTYQITRLERAVESCRAHAERTELSDDVVAEFEEQKAAWELRRAREAEQLVREQERLIAAWEEIEAERRRLLTEGRPRAGAFDVPGETPHDWGRAEPVGGEVAEASRVDVEAGEDGGAAVESWRQFEQLKREFRRHGRKR